MPLSSPLARGNAPAGFDIARTRATKVARPLNRGVIFIIETGVQRRVEGFLAQGSEFQGSFIGKKILDVFMD
jgi:hypothetical protein